MTSIWVRYNGKRQGEFGVRGPSTGIVYKISGQGHEFEIWTVDASIFRRSGRGRDFSVGIAPPAQEPEPEPVPAAPPAEYEAPSPQMAELLALDEVAREERGLSSQPAQAATPSPAAVQSPPPLVPSEPETQAGPPPLPTAQELNLDTEMDEVDQGTAISIAQEQRQENPLEPLGLGQFQQVLEEEGWTITGLANADPAELVPYPGIGSKRARNIIERAQANLEG